LAYKAALLSACAVSDVQQLATDLEFERMQELEDPRSPLSALSKKRQWHRHQRSPAIADTYVHAKLCWMIGVWPPGAEVRVTGRFFDRPDLSMKTSCSQGAKVSMRRPANWHENIS